VVARAAARRNPEGASWDSSLGSTFGDQRRRDFIRFGVPALPQGARLADPRHHGSPNDLPNPESVPTSFDLADTARLASRQIAPLDAGIARLVARIPGLAGLLVGIEAADSPTHVAFGPVIDEALMWSLVEMAPELLLPGVDEFPNNAVRVVETNPAYVASFLAGANHEMARELLWREYPADLTATTFRRFWDRPDRTAVDIDPIADWLPLQQLEQLGASTTESIVLLIRGDLVRHYPNVRVLLVDPDTSIGKLPAFDGWIPPDVRFVGFDVEDAQTVTAPGSGWRIALEELPTEPRFGLDNVAQGAPLPPLKTWDDLAWEHLTGHDDATHLRIGATFPSDSPAPPDATWGLNSAHMARATYQRPYRRTLPVDQLIGAADE
jgi:hypothetical protein